MIVQRTRSERRRSRELRKQAELLSRRLRRSGRDTFALRLARVRPAVALVRHDLGRWLERRGVAPALARDVVLACSEACANAVEHPVDATKQSFEVEAARRDGELVVTVRDSGRWRTGPTLETRGRGMQLIRALMDDVEVVQGVGGTEIVMRSRLP